MCPAGQLVVPGTGDDHERLRLIDTRDVVFRAIQKVVVAVANGVRGQLVRVRTRVGLGDREDHLGLARRHAREPPLTLVVAAVLRNQFPGDGTGDEQEQQWTAVGGGFLADQGELRHPGAAPAVLLREVDPDETAVTQCLP